MWPCHHKLLSDSVPFEWTQQFTFMFLQLLRKEKKKGKKGCQSVQCMSRLILTLTHTFPHLPLRLKSREFMLLTWSSFYSITLTWKRVLLRGWAELCSGKENRDGFALKWSYFSELVNESALSWAVTTPDWRWGLQCFGFLSSHLLGCIWN